MGTRSKVADLTRHPAHALAAAGRGAGDIVDALTAIAVQQIQQQVLSILLQAAQPESSVETKTAAGSAGVGPAYWEESGKQLGEMSPSVSAGGEIKTLELRDLARLTRITVDLNRMMSAQRKRAEQPCERAGSHALIILHRNPKTMVSPKKSPGPYLTSYSPAFRSSLRPTAASSPPETTADPTKSVPGTAMPAKAQRGTSEGKQPQLTAPDRIYPHRKDRSTFAIYRHPLSLVLSCRPEAHFPLTSGRR